MKGFAAANTPFKEIHPDSSGGAAGEPQGLEQTVAPQTGGDMTTVRSDTLLKKKKKNLKKHSKHILGQDGMFAQLTSQNRISLCSSQHCKGNSLYEN